MILSFKLSMPGCNSWNGRWSGEDKCYVKTVALPRTQLAKAERLLEKGYFSYDFGDGWRAGVAVSKVDSREAAKLRKKSSGFCGYDWMVTSIMQHEEIRSS